MTEAGGSFLVVSSNGNRPIVPNRFQDAPVSLQPNTSLLSQQEIFVCILTFFNLFIGINIKRKKCSGNIYYPIHPHSCHRSIIRISRQRYNINKTRYSKSSSQRGARHFTLCRLLKSVHRRIPRRLYEDIIGKSRPLAKGSTVYSRESRTQPIYWRAMVSIAHITGLPLELLLGPVQ